MDPAFHKLQRNTCAAHIYATQTATRPVSRMFLVRKREKIAHFCPSLPKVSLNMMDEKFERAHRLEGVEKQT